MKKVPDWVIGWLLIVKISLAVAGLSLSLCGCIDMTNGVIDDTENQCEPVVKGEFRCLILLETADQTKMPESQLQIITSPKLRAYMKQHTVKGPDGKTDEFRIYDDDTKLTGSWAQMVKDNQPGALPWLYCTNGKKGLSAPLPNSVDEVIAKVKPYAEP